MTTFFPSPSHWAWGHGFKPQHRQKKITHRFASKRQMFFAWFHNWKLPSFLPSSSSIFWQKPQFHANSFYFFFLSKYTKVLVWLKTFTCRIWGTQCINPLFAITQASSALIMLRSSESWIRQQLDKWSVVEPTWLLSSNWEASLCGHERLKDQAARK